MTRFLLVQNDLAADATGGYKYSSSEFSVLFPGEPDVTTQDLGSGVIADMAQWQNKQLVYTAAHFDGRNPAATLQTTADSASQSAGTTVVSSQAFPVPGGTGLLVEATLEDETLWTLYAFDDASQVFVLTHNGDRRDDAFFDSFRIL